MALYEILPDPILQAAQASGMALKYHLTSYTHTLNQKLTSPEAGRS